MSTGAPKSSVVLLEVSVRGTPRAPRRRRAAVAFVFTAAAALAAAAAVVAVELSGARGARPAVNPVAHERGAAGVAAAYGHPLGCLTVTILPSEPTYARADFDHQTACGRYTGYPTAIFHYASRTWHAVLDAVAYACPVRSLPPPVQIELGVCLYAGDVPARREHPPRATSR